MLLGALELFALRGSSLLRTKPRLLALLLTQLCPVDKGTLYTLACCQQGHTCWLLSWPCTSCYPYCLTVLALRTLLYHHFCLSWPYTTRNETTARQPLLAEVPTRNSARTGKTRSRSPHMHGTRSPRHHGENEDELYHESLTGWGDAPPGQAMASEEKGGHERDACTPRTPSGHVAARRGTWIHRRGRAGWAAAPHQGMHEEEERGDHDHVLRASSGGSRSRRRRRRSDLVLAADSNADQAPRLGFVGASGADGQGGGELISLGRMQIFRRTHKVGSRDWRKKAEKISQVFGPSIAALFAKWKSEVRGALALARAREERAGLGAKDDTEWSQERLGRALGILHQRLACIFKNAAEAFVFLGLKLNEGGRNVQTISYHELKRGIYRLNLQVTCQRIVPAADGCVLSEHGIRQRVLTLNPKP